MAEKVILSERTLDGFALYEGYGLYGQAIKRVELTVGNTYEVVWDGNSWPCIAQDLSALMAGAVVLGNVSAFGGGGNNEPFIIMTVSSSDLDTDVISLTDTEPSTHTIAIYQVEAQQSGIILRDYKGEETTETGVETLEVDNTEGGTTKFVREDLVPETVEKTVELDFSGGPMTVTPGAGQAFSQIQIPVPDGLEPENIPEGMVVAGLVGTLVAGGGVKIATGTFVGSGAVKTIEHGLGVIPDIVLVATAERTTSSPSKAYLTFAFGVSSAFSEANNMFAKIRAIGVNMMNSENVRTATKTAIDSPSGYGALGNATTDSFAIIDDVYPPYSGFTYAWIAIGGLT